MAGRVRVQITRGIEPERIMETLRARLAPQLESFAGEAPAIVRGVVAPGGTPAPLVHRAEQNPPDDQGDEISAPPAPSGEEIATQLTQSIGAQFDPNALTVTVTADRPGAISAEFGTMELAARPFMTEAVARLRARLRDVLARG